MGHTLQIDYILRNQQGNLEEIEKVSEQLKTAQDNRVRLRNDLKKAVGELINTRPSETLQALFDTSVTFGDFTFYHYFRNCISATLGDMPAKYCQVVLPGDYTAGTQLAESIKDDMIGITTVLQIVFSIEKSGSGSPVCCIQFAKNKIASS